MATLSPMPRPVTRLGSVLLIALALVAAGPTTAMAQGSGDEQYADPFGDLPDESAQAPPGESAPADPSPPDRIDATKAPELSAIQPAPENAESADAVEAGSGDELARTGLPVRFLLATGLALLGTGVLLHLCLERPQAPRSRT